MAASPTRRLAGKLLLVALIGWVLATAWLVASALVSLQAAAADAEALETSLDDLDDVTDPALVARLEAVGADFRTGADALANPLVAPLRLLPVAGRQLQTVTAMAEAGAEVSATGSHVVGEVAAALEQPHDTGPGRVALVRRVAAAAGRADRRLATVDLGPDHHLVGAVAQRRQRFAARLGELRSTLQSVASGGAVAGDLLEGPSRYLLLAANNAEMRAGSGMFLSIGVVEFRGGEIALGDLRSTSDLVLEPPGVELDRDMAARWGWAEPGRDLRNLAMTPRFPASAEAARRMWQHHNGELVDGVLAVDVMGLAGLVRATGPLEVDGATRTPEELVEYLLKEQYQAFHGDALFIERKEQLGRIAREAVQAIGAGRFEPRVLASSLADAVAGRHLLGWSADASAQQAWVAAGADGALRDESLAVAVLNIGGNKLDPYLDVDVRLEGAAGPSGLAVTVDVRNGAPEGLPAYVAGPHPSTDLSAGEHLAVVAVTLPAAAGDVSLLSASPAEAFGPDGTGFVVAAPVRLLPGASASVTVRFHLPEGHSPLWIEPSARVPASDWTHRDARWADDRGRTRNVSAAPVAEEPT